MSLAAVVIGSFLAISQARAAPLFDETTGPLLGVGGGVVKLTTGLANTDDPVRKGGGKLLVGYRFNKYLAVEASLFKAGLFDRSAGPLVYWEIDADILQGALVGTLPFGTSGFSAFARYGLNRWDTEISRCATFGGRYPCRGGNSEGYDPAWGVGLAYTTAAYTILRVELERTKLDDPIGALGPSPPWRLQFINFTAVF